MREARGRAFGFLCTVVILAMGCSGFIYWWYSPDVMHQCPFQKSDACPYFSNVGTNSILISWQQPVAGAHLVRRYELHMAHTYKDQENSEEQV